MNIESLLRWYIDNNIKPTKKENEKIQYIYSSNEWIKELLKENWYICFRSGSYARWTAIDPVHDLDIICESDEQDIEDFMNWDKWTWLYKILSEKFWRENVDFQSRSIWISFIWESDFWIDIVVAKKITDEFNEFKQNLYEVPNLLYKSRLVRKDIYKNNEGIKLIKSDPKWYKEEIKIIKNFNDNIIYATRFLKKWRNEMKKEFFTDNDKILKSFHIEEVIKKIVKENQNIWLLDLLVSFVDNLNLEIANIPDRADNKIMIDSYTEEESFKSNISKINSILTLLKEGLLKLNSTNSVDGFNQIINKIFFIKEKEEITIDNKQKSYYVIN